MDTNFKILSIKEEQDLSREELKIYYQEFRKYILERKLTNTTPGARTIAPKLKGITAKIATAVTKAFTNKNIEWVCEGNTDLPEGTWNLSPNKLHLPLSFGIVDVAKKAKVPIIPVVHEFTYETATDKECITKIYSKYGKPIYVDEEDDLLLKLREYEDSISTIRYELIEDKGLYKRSEITNSDYINFLKANYKNLKLGKLNLKRERNHIFGGNQDFYVFHHINDIPFNEHGVLLETEEVRKLKRINRREKLHKK